MGHFGGSLLSGAKGEGKGVVNLVGDNRFTSVKRREGSRDGGEERRSGGRIVLKEDGAKRRHGYEAGRLSLCLNLIGY